MKPDNFEQYRALIEQVPTMTWHVGREAKCEYVNSAWLAFTGRTFHEEMSDGWLETFHPDDRAAVVGACADGVQKHQAFDLEARLRRHDGAYRRVLLRGAPLVGTDGLAGIVGSCIDTDDLWNRDSVAGAAEFFEMSLDNLCVAGFDGYMKRVSPSWSKTLGWTPEELTSRPSIEFVHPDDRAHVLAARQGLASGQPLLDLGNRYRCKDGSYRWFEWRSVSDVDRGLVYAVARDVTEERQARLALLELTESLTTTLNSIADGVIATDADAVITRMNPVAEKLTGWSANDAAGLHLHDVFNIVTDTGTTAAPLVERSIREGSIAGIGSEALLVARGGAKLLIASTFAPMRHPDGTVSGAVVVFRDMTAEKQAKEEHEQLQRQLIFADRMASVGTLAAGVAHEINNPLAYVMANLEILVEEMKPDHSVPTAQLAEWAELAVESHDGAERIKKIVRELKTFSRAEEQRLAVIDLRPVLELSIDMAFNEIKHRARLVKDYATTPLVEADDARLGQVFVNLLVNAAQALPERAVGANEIRVVTSTDAEGRAVVEVRDTGPGISESAMNRIFDPFFTTKPVGIGTGLGLWICHNIVTSLGGEITAGNRPGGGATFRVMLPAATRRDETVRPDAAPRQSVARRAAVLVVDDDRAVGVAIRRVLRGHDVTVVASAKDALDLLESRSFDVILSDLMMPEMSGMELYERLADSRPEDALRMVFVTGGAFTPSATTFLDRVPNERMEKPFDAAALRELVQRFVKK